MEIEECVRKWALDNARKHDGSANVGSVVGSVIGELPEVKPDLKSVMPVIKSVVEEVNALSVDQQLAELERLAPELLERKKVVEEKALKPLPDAEGQVVMRIAPSPSGPLHIGHAFVLSLNSEYCRMYDGRLIVRIEDTNPENIYGPAYDLIPEDADWLTDNNVESYVIQSDRLDLYYKYAKELLEQGNAYVCTCDPDEFRRLVSKKVACPCRSLSVGENLARWQSMFDGYQPGEAVMRVKTDVSDPNPALRDWPAFRINDHEHPRKGTDFRVWPLMNFSVSVDDHELGMTHTVRGMDHVDNARRQAQLFGFFGWKKPVHLYFGRINFEGLVLSSSEVKKQIQYGHYSGWDDIRLPFLPAMRRRGYQPGAFIRFAVEMGINKTDKTVPASDFFAMLNAFNRDIIDPSSDRFFFVADPVEINIVDAPEAVCQLPVHPDFPERGTRELSSGNAVYISRPDFDRLKQGELYRLMECYNFVKEKDSFRCESLEYEAFRDKGGMIMHWLPKSEGLVSVEVVMPSDDMSEIVTVKGLGEPGLSRLEEGDIVQFERFGFVRLDRIEDDKLVFWFAHR